MSRRHSHRLSRRAKRSGLELDITRDLTALDETGVADEAVAARAQAELPEIEYAAFQQGQAQSLEHFPIIRGHIRQRRSSFGTR